MTEFGDLEIWKRSCGSENFMVSLTTAERQVKRLKFFGFEVMVISVIGLWLVPILMVMVLLSFVKLASISWNSGLWIVMVWCVCKGEPRKGWWSLPGL